MKVIIYILQILLMVLQGQSTCYTGPKKLDSECATYCYQVVKPLLKFADSVTSQSKDFSELDNKIKEQSVTELKDRIKEQAAIIENLKSQLTLHTELIDSHKENIHYQKQVNLQNEKHIETLDSELKIKEKYLSDLQSEVASKDIRISDINSETAWKEKIINDLRFEIELKNTKLSMKYENNIPSSLQTSTCIGKSNQVYRIEVRDTEKLTVPCDTYLAGSGWTVIQRRMEGTVDFYRNWSDYKSGFGNVQGEFFIGLEMLYLMTNSQPHELYISLMNINNETGYARYTDFAIGNEEEFYKLKKLGSYYGNVGNAMKTLRNIDFSTPDTILNRKNKLWPDMFNSGWWLEGNIESNLNGKYIYKGNNNSTVSGMKWKGWKDDQRLIFTQMMIRPKSD